MSPPQCLPFFPLLPLVLCCCTAQYAGNTLSHRSCILHSNVSSHSHLLRTSAGCPQYWTRRPKLDGYLANSSGQNKGKVYGLAQCWGDVSKEDCGSCIRCAAKQVHRKCPNLGDIRMWYCDVLPIYRDLWCYNVNHTLSGISCFNLVSSSKLIVSAGMTTASCVTAWMISSVRSILRSG